MDRFLRGGRSAVALDGRRPSSTSAATAEERGARGHDPGIGFLVGVCIPKKERDKTIEHSLRALRPTSLHPLYTPSNATSHWITDTLIKGGFQLSASRCPYLVVLGQLERRMEDILVIQFLVYWLGHNRASCCVSYACVCVLKHPHPLYADTHSHALTHADRTRPERARPGTTTLQQVVWGPRLLGLEAVLGQLWRRRPTAWWNGTEEFDWWCAVEGWGGKEIQARKHGGRLIQGVRMWVWRLEGDHKHWAEAGIEKPGLGGKCWRDDDVQAKMNKQHRHYHLKFLRFYLLQHCMFLLLCLSWLFTYKILKFNSWDELFSFLLAQFCT